MIKSSVKLLSRPVCAHTRLSSSVIVRNMSSTKDEHPMLSALRRDADKFQSLKYSVKERVAHIMLDRPARMNAIDMYMPGELVKAVELANLDDSVKVSIYWQLNVYNADRCIHFTLLSMI